MNPGVRADTGGAPTGSPADLPWPGSDCSCHGCWSFQDSTSPPQGTAHNSNDTHDTCCQHHLRPSTHFCTAVRVPPRATTSTMNIHAHTLPQQPHLLHLTRACHPGGACACTCRLVSRAATHFSQPPPHTQHDDWRAGAALLPAATGRLHEHPAQQAGPRSSACLACCGSPPSTAIMPC